MHSPLARLCLLALLLLPGCLSRPAQQTPTTQPASSLPSRLHETLTRLSSTGATISARVIDLSTGRELYAADPDRPVIPASNMKLPVSAAALDHFGATHSFKTHLAISGHDLYLIGTGDPATGDPRLASRHNPRGKPTDLFDTWAAALQQRGITHINGNLYYYAKAFDQQLTHPSWSRSFLTDWYAAPVSGLNFNDNCIDVTLYPTEEGQLVRYEVMPPTSSIKIINNCTTGTGNPSPAISRARDSNTFTLTGTCSRKTTLESKPVIDPAAFFADALRTHLASKGITISGQTRPAPSIPPDHQIIATHETRMPDLLWRLNKNSQNLFAEALCKSLGAATTNQPGSWQTGGAAVRAFLRKHNIDDTNLVLTDGSGLARSNRLTTRLITDLLFVMHRHPHAAVFRASLPISGTDGTIASRMKDIQGHIHAKTGYIGGVRSLSGYATTRSGRTLAFSFIYNNIPGTVKPYEALQDEACRILVEATDADLDR